MGIIIPADADWAKGVEIEFTNREVYYPALKTPVQGKYGMAWKFAIPLTPEEANFFASLGKNLGREKKKDQNGNLVETGVMLLGIEQKVSRPDGTPNKPPWVVGLNGTDPIDADIGHGSLCNIRIWMKKSDGGVPTYLNGIQVLNLIAKRNTAFKDLTRDTTALDGITATVAGATVAPPVQQQQFAQPPVQQYQAPVQENPPVQNNPAGQQYTPPVQENPPVQQQQFTPPVQQQQVAPPVQQQAFVPAPTNQAPAGQLAQVTGDDIPF